MIRKFESKDMERVMQIWLEGNIETHDFVPGDYWLSQFIKKTACSGLLFERGFVYCVRRN